ncbi:hypothetical protein [Enterococcus sp. AZ109]|uniref:hypothetical protein n=1 Tax=Enterococcus sp. AZ109 TaxID=2774634 RepID=UPI003F683CB5
MEDAIFDNNISVFEATKNSSERSYYYLYYGEGTTYYAVVRVSGHKPYSGYYSYRSFFPFGFTESKFFSESVREYLYGLSWNRLSYAEYFYLQMMRYGHMGIYIVGGKKNFGARWHPQGALEFVVKNEYTNENYPANRVLTRAFRKMVSNGLLGHQIKNKKLRLVVAQTAKIICKRTRNFYHPQWEKDRLMYDWQDIKPLSEIDEYIFTQAWQPPQVYFSAHGMNKHGEIISKVIEPSQNITSIIIDTPQKNAVLETYDMLHRIKIYRRKNSIIHQIIKKNIGIISEMDYQIEKKKTEKFFNLLIYDMKIDQWTSGLDSKKSLSQIKVRHSDLHMKKFDVDNQEQADLLNLKNHILSLVDFEIIPPIFWE